MENEIILEANNLSKVFGGLVAVDNVDIKIRKQTMLFHCPDQGNLLLVFDYEINI